MSNPYQPHDPNNPYGSQPERGYDHSGQPQGGQPAQGAQPSFDQPVPPPYDQYGQPIQPQYGPPHYGQPPMAYGGQPGYQIPVAPISQRPVGVSIIAVLNWISGGLMGLGSLLMLIIVVVLGNVASDSAGATDPLLGFGIAFFGVLMGILLVIGALAIVVGVGLWRLRPWAQVIQIILCGLYILAGLASLADRDTSGGGLGLFIAAIVVMVYLLLPTTRAAFRR